MGSSDGGERSETGRCLAPHQGCIGPYARRIAFAGVALPSRSRRSAVAPLARHIPEDAERGAVRTKVLGHAELLPLHDRETGESAGRFTTRAVRRQEREALADGARVAAAAHRDIGAAARAAAPSAAALRPDQRAAFEHATAPGGLKIIEGRAGTGKSFTLGAIRKAHEAAGYEAVGLAPTNAVAQDLGHDGFKRTSTVHAELFRLKNGHAAWGRRTLVVVDEMAMLDAKVTGELLREAKMAGAKVVGAGDDRQLASIERGGLFTELRRAHGSAEISHVTRQRVDWQREAARDLSEGRFEEALRAFARNKAVIWTTRQADTRSKLVEQWSKDTAADPQASRFVFAYTNKDVDALNRNLRAVRRERGELGPDHAFTTKHGQAAFAVGDRVQFTDTLKGAGIYNGNAGVITGIDRETGRIKATLDAAAGREGRLVSWSASEFTGFRHGYAGTIYKGQGKTLDHTYLMHTPHWRAASSYVALTRQRESAKVFAAVETARDIRQLARQIGRAEIKSASIAYATRDELTPAQKARAAEQAREAARATAQQGAKARPGAPARPQQPARSAIARPAAPRSQYPDGRAPEAAAKPIGAERTARPPAPAPARTAPAGVLIPAFEGRGRDGVERDSLGRGVDGKSVAAVVASDAQVRRELEARSIYLQTAYRDPRAATTRLNELVARDGATSAARRLSTEPGCLGELRGREGLFAGGKARAERQAAMRAAAAIGPNVTRLSEAEAQAAQGYRASVAAQLKADRHRDPEAVRPGRGGLKNCGGRQDGPGPGGGLQDAHGRCGHEARGRHVPQIRRGALRRGGRPRHGAGRGRRQGVHPRFRPEGAAIRAGRRREALRRGPRRRTPGHPRRRGRAPVGAPDAGREAEAMMMFAPSRGARSGRQPLAGLAHRGQAGSARRLDCRRDLRSDRRRTVAVFWQARRGGTDVP